MFVKTHSSNCLSAGMYHNILLQKCISFSEVKNIPRNPTKFAIHSSLSCINATGTSKTIQKLPIMLLPPDKFITPKLLLSGSFTSSVLSGPNVKLLGKLFGLTCSKMDAWACCINATGTRKRILGAVHHAIATRRVYHTETIAIWKFRFISSFSSECEITREVVWADTLKDGCWSLLVKGRHLDVTCRFRKTKSKRRERICWSKGWSRYADIGTKKLRFILNQLLLCPCGKQVHRVC